MITLLSQSETMDPFPSGGGRGLADALLPDLPLLDDFVLSPGDEVDAFAAIRAEQEAYNGPKRQTLVRVTLEPGTYSMVGQDMVLIQSSTGNPADVIIESGISGGGTLHWFGGPTWLRGVTLRSVSATDGGTGPKYPLHMTGGGTLTLIDCHLDAANPDSDGGDAILGMDGGDGLDVAFVRCRFSNLDEGDHWTNIHGGGIGALGQRIIFYDCTLDGSRAAPVSFNGDPAERTDIYLVEGNITSGTMNGDVHVYTDQAPLTVGGFSARQRLLMGITSTPAPPSGQT